MLAIEPYAMRLADSFALMSTYSERTLEGNLVLLDVLNGSIRNSGLAVLDNGGDIDRLPSNGGLNGIMLA